MKDSFIYFDLASTLANQIEMNGWRAFDWAPHAQFPAGLLGACFALSGIHSVLWQIPINIIIVGSSCFLLGKILEEFGFSRRSCLVFILIFLFTPTSLMWVTQIAKDGYMVWGIICLFYSHILIRKHLYLRSCILFIFGSWSIFFIKSFYSEIFVIAYGVGMGILLLSKSYRNLKFILLVGAIISTFLLQFQYANKYYADIPKDSEVIEIKTTEYKVEKINFNYNSQFPMLDMFLKRLSFRHYRFHKKYAHGNENTEFRQLDSTIATLLYMPEAFFISLLEPLPWKIRWVFNLKGFLYTLLQIEMFSLYFCLTLIFLGWFNLTYDERILLLSWFAITATFLIIYAYAAPNIGAINRYRFPFLIGIKCFGVLAGLRLFKNRAALNSGFVCNHFKNYASFKQAGTE